jgi:hypothetical protein
MTYDLAEQPVGQLHVFDRRFDGDCWTHLLARRACIDVNGLTHLLARRACIDGIDLDDRPLMLMQLIRWRLLDSLACAACLY